MENVLLNLENTSIIYNNGRTRRHSRPNSDINHTLKHRFPRHTDKAVLQTEQLLSIAAENSFLIATIGLLPKLHLASDGFADFHLQIIKILNNFALIDELTKPVGAMAVRIVKMIPDEVGTVSLALHGEHIAVEVGDGHGVGVKFPQWNVFLFQGIIDGLFTFISAHGYYLRYTLSWWLSRN